MEREKKLDEGVMKAMIHLSTIKYLIMQINLVFIYLLLSGILCGL